MVYPGSKAKYANKIVPILQHVIDDNHITTYIEPFVGGANIIDKIYCPLRIGYDKNATLIALHQQGQVAPQTIPEHGDADWWYTAKDIYRQAEGDPTLMAEQMPLWKIGAIAFFKSFSKRGFAGGMAKDTPGHDYYNTGYRNFIQQVAHPNYKTINFQWAPDALALNFDECAPALIYNDPPYAGTKPYGYAFETAFDYKAYWDWVRTLSTKHFVICSEQTFPDDFRILWSQEVRRTNGSDNNFKAVEKLGVWTQGLAANI